VGGDTASYTRPWSVDEADDALQREMDVVTGALRADTRDLRVFFPVLAAKLADALPDAVTVERDSGLLSRRRTVRRLRVHLDEDLLEAELTPAGLVCREVGLLTGISQEVSFDAWMRLLLAGLRERARTTAQASAALRSLLT
jgi:hypothetical protein